MRIPGSRLAVAVTFGAIACAAMFLAGASGRPTPLRPASIVAVTDTDESEESEPDYRSLMIGVWEDDVEGGRVLTRNADGTDVMVANLTGPKRFLSKALTMYATWSIEGTHVQVQLLRGEPPALAEMAVRLRGNTLDQQLIRVNEDEMILEGSDGTVEHWRRVKEE